ncbi:Globin [Macleaya cordata]|uniref:Globin n=1 Tax=Macleaya cordata TaxID=56857 RepID=A0A200PNY6_MACCD|nr:Globin [Macleaya cordata]
MSPRACLWERIATSPSPHMKCFNSVAVSHKHRAIRLKLVSWEEGEVVRNSFKYKIFKKLIGIVGSPALTGHPALIGRHRPFPVTHQAAERWLHHMQLAVDSIPDIDADSKIKMMNFFRHSFNPKTGSDLHTAYFLVAGDELKNQNQQGPPCKHASTKSTAV